MKHLCTILATVLAAAFCASAKTFDWPIDAPTAGARQFTAYHGETVRFNLQFRGAMTNLTPAAIYYQTNGMGKAEWFGPVPGTVFHPTNDCGAAVYRFFILCNDPDGKDYTANGSLRLLDSPGFVPNELPLPVQTIDFSRIEVLNPPWPSSADVEAIVSASVTDATNGIPRITESYNTPGWAANAEYAQGSANAAVADFAQDAERALSLGDLGESRTFTQVFSQLDAATKTNAEQDATLAGKASTDDVCNIVTNTVGGDWNVSVWDVASQYSDFFDGGIVAVGYDSDWGELTLTTSSGTVNFFAASGEWPDDDVYVGDAYARDDGGEWGEWVAYIELRREPVRNALGLARLEDLPSNIVTTANVESEVTRQLNGVDQVRSRRILRADRPYEYGNGWGVMIYDFTSDRRWWEIKAPSPSVSVSAPSPLSNLSPASRVVRSFVRTDGTNGVDRCASATWRIGVIDLNDGTHGLDITATTTNGSVSIVSASGGGIGAKIAYGNTGYYQQHYIFRNFRVSQAAGSTVSGLYDYEEKPPRSSNYTTYSNQTWSVTLSPGSYSTTTNEYLRVINTIDHHRYYDPGLGCTWEISVTNGCFFAEQVSTNNLLQGGF